MVQSQIPEDTVWVCFPGNCLADQFPKKFLLAKHLSNILYAKDNKREFPCDYCKEVVESLGIPKLKPKCGSSTCMAIGLEKNFLQIALLHLFDEHPELLE